MPIHERVLEAALRICRERGGWTFRPAEVAAEVADLNLASVRTHVMSRCCVNAPSHHAHRWPYFRRISRGVYTILPAWREPDGRRHSTDRALERSRASSSKPRPASIDSGPRMKVRESAPDYVVEIPAPGGRIQPSVLDELTRRLRRIARNSLEVAGGSARPLRIRITVELEQSDPVIEAHAKDIDRTLIRKKLSMSHEERLVDLERWMNAMAEIRGAAQPPPGTSSR